MLVVVGCVVCRVALSLYQCSLLGVVSAILGSSSIRLIHLPGCILEKKEVAVWFWLFLYIVAIL
jgi:hypothetical protein